MKALDDVLLNLAGAEEGTLRGGGGEPGVPLPVENLHPFRTTEAIGEGRGAAWAAEMMADEMRGAGLELRDGWPVFDLVLLGLGGDGHLLSVFPHSAIFDSTEWTATAPAPTHIEPHVERVTMHPSIITAARDVLMVATGAGKVAAIGHIFGDPLDVRTWPGQVARTEHAVWLLDAEAAAGLSRMTDLAGITIRRARDDDADAIGDVWLGAWYATFDFPPGHPDEDVRRWLRDELVPAHETWVAEAPDGRVVALMALSDDMVEQLYVAPDRAPGRRRVAVARAGEGAAPGGAGPLLLPGEYASPALLRGARVRRRRRRGRQRQRGAAAGHPIRVAARVTASMLDDAASDAHDAPERRWTATSPDGTAIAVTTVGSGPPLLLVHGAAADHTTFRVVVPLLAPRFTTHAIDRRGRGGSGDTAALRPRARVRGCRRRGGGGRVRESVAPSPRSATRSAVGACWAPRCGRRPSAASCRTKARRARRRARYGDEAVLDDLRRLDGAGDRDALFETFLRRVVGLDDAGVAALSRETRLAATGRGGADDRRASSRGGRPDGSGLARRHRGRPPAGPAAAGRREQRRPSGSRPRRSTRASPTAGSR